MHTFSLTVWMLSRQSGEKELCEETNILSKEQELQYWLLW